MFAVILLCGLATSYGINASCYRDEDEIFVELIGNQLRKDATAVETVNVVGNADRCMDHCLYKGYCVSFNAIQENHQIKCELFNITSNDRILLKEHVNSSYYEVNLTCHNSPNVANVSGCGNNCLMKRDCDDWLQEGLNENGMYKININGESIEVYCKLKDGHPWIEFLRQTSGQWSSDRNWNDYVDGFNDNGNFWLGLQYLHQLTATGNYLFYFETLNMFFYGHFKIHGNYSIEIKSCENCVVERNIRNIIEIKSCENCVVERNISFKKCDARNRYGWFTNDCGGINLSSMKSMMLRKDYH